MEPRSIVALLVMGGVLAVGSLLIRIRSAGKVEIKPIDLTCLVIPLLLLGLGSGKLKILDFGGVKADFSELWKRAAETNIEGQVGSAQASPVSDAVHTTEMVTKGGVGELETLQKRKIEALEFRLGGGGYYYGPAIQQYLDALTGNSYLRVLVLNERDGTLFGVYNASDLVGHLRVTKGYGEFERLLNRQDGSEREDLSRLPGFVSANDAVSADTSKRDALARMEHIGGDMLPVVENGRYVGIVERSKLTASLILAVTDKLAAR